MSTASSVILKNNENVTFVSNPSITYFKSVYRKHTKFIIAYKEDSPSDNTFSNSDNINIDLTNFGDLLCDISLKVSIDETTDHTPINKSWPNDISLFLIDNILLKMVGPNIELDKLDKDYINFNAMLNNPKSLNSTYNIKEGTLTCDNGNNYQNMALCGGVINNNSIRLPIKKMNAIIPLPFAFCKSIGTAIPLCALNTTNKHLQIILSTTNNTQDDFSFTTDDPVLNNNIIGLFKYSIISKYIFLSDEEKIRFLNSKQEYLYERVNVLNNGNSFTGEESTIIISDLNPNHPIKSIYLYNQKTTEYNKLKYKIDINGQQIFSDNFNHEFFSKVEILNRFKGCIYNMDQPGVSDKSNTIIDNNIAMIDFSLKNSDNPSGCISPNANTINLFIHNIKDNHNIPYNIKIYTVSYYLLSINNDRIAYVFD